MTSPRKPGFMLSVPVAMVVPLLTGYVGAYYWVADVQLKESAGFWHTMNYELFVVEHQWCRLFAPVHWVDRRIRPHVWEPK